MRTYKLYAQRYYAVSRKFLHIITSEVSGRRGVYSVKDSYGSESHIRVYTVYDSHSRKNLSMYHADPVPQIITGYSISSDVLLALNIDSSA